MLTGLTPGEVGLEAGFRYDSRREMRNVTPSTNRKDTGTENRTGKQKGYMGMERHTWLEGQRIVTGVVKSGKLPPVLIMWCLLVMLSRSYAPKLGTQSGFISCIYN